MEEKEILMILQQMWARLYMVSVSLFLKENGACPQ